MSVLLTVFYNKAQFSTEKPVRN